jgi:hypothetical protein
VEVTRIHPTLNWQYEGPFRVLQWGPKAFVIDLDGEEDTVSIDCLIPTPSARNIQPLTVTHAGRGSRQPTTLNPKTQPLPRSNHFLAGLKVPFVIYP